MVTREYLVRGEVLHLGGSNIAITGSISTGAAIANGQRVDSIIPDVSSEDDIAYLDKQVEDLTKALIDKYGDYNEETFEEIDYTFVSDAITDWNIESDRGEARFLQMGAAQELGIPISDYIKSKIPNPGAEFPEERKLAREIYDNTQQALSWAGVKPEDLVMLYRGSSRKVSGIGIISNPLESWTTSKEVAEFYVKRKGAGFVLETAIPARDIFSVPQAGLGIPSAKEVVILGSKPHPVQVAK